MRASRPTAARVDGAIPVGRAFAAVCRGGPWPSRRHCGGARSTGRCEHRPLQRFIITQGQRFPRQAGPTGSAPLLLHSLAGFQHKHEQDDVDGELDDVLDQAQAAEHNKGLAVGDMQPQRREQEVEQQHHVQLAQNDPPQLERAAVKPQAVQNADKHGAERPAREIGAVGAQDVAQDVGDDAGQPGHPRPAQVADGRHGEEVEADFQQLGDRDGELVEHKVERREDGRQGQRARAVQLLHSVDTQARQAAGGQGGMVHDIALL